MKKSGDCTTLRFFFAIFRQLTAYPAKVLGAQTPRLFGLDRGLLRVQTYGTAGRGSIVKRLTVALLVFGLFTPTVFAQTAKQKEMVFPSCVEIISGTERHLQCENVITPTAEPTGEKSLPGRKGGKAQAKRLTPEQHKASATKGSCQGQACVLSGASAGKTDS